MKRTAALTPLSHDHHQALFQAQQLRRATDQNVAEVRDGVLAFWAGDGAKHFRIEEEVLLPAFAAAGDPGDDAVVTVLVDHVWIRERMERLAEEALDLVGVHELGERLTAHVRHEERVLFPLIEETLDPESLAALGRRVADAEAK